MTTVTVMMDMNSTSPIQDIDREMDEYLRFRAGFFAFLA